MGQGSRMWGAMAVQQFACSEPPLQRSLLPLAQALQLLAARCWVPGILWILCTMRRSGGRTADLFTAFLCGHGHLSMTSRRSVSGVDCAL